MKATLILLLALSAPALVAQDPPDRHTTPLGPAEVAGIEGTAAAGAFLERLQTEKIELLRESGQVRFPAVVLRDQPSPAYPVEYLIVTDGGSTHETIFLTRVTPSLLNACLLALGLTPGRTIRFVKREGRDARGTPAEADRDGATDGRAAAGTPPEEEEPGPYAVIPPQGQVVFIYVTWPGDDGQEVIHPLEDLLTDVHSGEMLPVRGFVYVGSRFRRTLYRGKLRDVYMADIEGNLAASYLSGLGNCLFDINSSMGQWDDVVAVNGALMPPRETVVRIVVSLRPIAGTRAPEPDALRVSGLDLDPLILKERSHNPVLATASGEALTRFVGLTFAQLAGRLASDDPEDRRDLAAALLGACGSPAAAPILLGALREADTDALREAIGQALAELGTFDGITGLIDLLAVDDEALRAAAHRALVRHAGVELPADREAWRDWLQANIDRFR